MSPIVTRQISKRRYTNNSGNCSGLDSDTEGPPLSSKRQCTSFSKSGSGCGSPLVRDPPIFNNPNSFSMNGGAESPLNCEPPSVRASSPLSECSTTSSLTFFKPRQLNEPTQSYSNLSNSATIDSDECGSIANDDGDTQVDQFNNGGKDDQSSTTFSSRACTPIDECDGGGGSRLPDEGPVQCTTPTGLIRTFNPGSSSPFTNRFLLPPSPLASQRLRDASEF